MDIGYIQVDYDGLLNRTNASANASAGDLPSGDICSVFDELLNYNKYMLDIKKLINDDSEFELEDISYSDQRDTLENLMNNISTLIGFPEYFEVEIKDCDEKFLKNFNNKALNKLSNLRMDEITLTVTDSTIVIKTMDGVGSPFRREFRGEDGVEFDLTISDFLGYDGHGSDIYYTKYVDGFTDVLYLPYSIENEYSEEDIEEYLIGYGDELENLIHNAEFDNTKIQPWVNLAAQCANVVSFGVYNVITGLVGFDIIRQEKLNEVERISYLKDGAQSIYGAGGALLSKSAKEIVIMQAKSVANNTISGATGIVLDEMEVDGIAKYAVNLAVSKGTCSAIDSVTSAKNPEPMSQIKIESCSDKINNLDSYYNEYMTRYDYDFSSGTVIDSDYSFSFDPYKSNLDSKIAWYKSDNDPYKFLVRLDRSIPKYLPNDVIENQKHINFKMVFGKEVGLL